MHTDQKPKLLEACEFDMLEEKTGWEASIACERSAGDRKGEQEKQSQLRGGGNGRGRLRFRQSGERGG